MALNERVEARPRLQSWKEVAAFFGKDERTVKRWESQRGLPIHRVPGGTRTTIYAYVDELRTWLIRDVQTAPDAAGILPEPAGPDPASPEAAPAERTSPPAAPQPLRRRPWALIAVVAGSLLATLGGLAVEWATRDPPAERTAAGIQARPHLPSSRANELYLLGVYHLETRTASGLTRAISYLNEAIALDPDYPEAYAKLAEAYNLVSQFTLLPPDEAYPRAKAAAERAIALDPGLAAGYAALAFTEFYWSWDFARSRALFEEALALDPGSATTHHWYALTLMHGGDFEIPLREIALAQQLDPRSSALLANRALILFHAGRVAEAVTILRQLADEQPRLLSPHAYLATIYLDQRRYQDFLREYAISAELEGNAGRRAAAIAAQQGFDQGGAPGMLAALYRAQKELYAQDREPAFKLAQTAALLGDRAAALDYLEASLARREQDILGILLEPALRPLRDEPRYRAVVAAVGLPLP